MEVETVSNTFEVTSLKQIKLSKKVVEAWNSLRHYQQQEGEGQMLANEVKYRGEPATLRWIKELSQLKKK